MHHRISSALIALVGLVLSFTGVGGTSPVVVINEVGWAGTAAASPNDEWIELFNRSQGTVDLTGWTLVFGDVVIHLGSVEGATTEVRSSVIEPGGYFLLERSDDSTVSDIQADLIYTGSLSNSGVVMRLLDASGAEVDTANAGIEGWAAGSATGTPPYASMERVDPAAPDTPSNWRTNSDLFRSGHDAQGNALNGTPRAKNSATTALETIPAVQLLAPAAEGTTVSDLFIITWIATDPDGLSDLLRIDLHLSRDGGATWEPLAGNLTNSGSYAWETKGVQNGENYRLKVIATDQVALAGEATSPLFSVVNPR